MSNMNNFADKYEEARKYWLDKLSGEIENTVFQYDFNIAGIDKKLSYSLSIDKELADKLTSISKGQDVLLFILLVAALKVLIYKYTNQTCNIVTSPIYNTTGESVESPKCILLKDEIDSRLTFKELLANVRSTIIEGYKNQHYPIEQIIDNESYNNKHSMFKTMILLENIHCMEHVSGIINSGENDITFVFQKANDIVSGNIIYNSALFSEHSIQCMCNAYNNVLKQVIKNINIAVSEIELISETERQRLLYQFNDTNSSYPQKKTISELFEEQVNSTPDNIAITIEENKLTYRELNEKSNRLARLLVEQGVNEGDIIAITVEYSLELVVGIMAILKAGAAYLPIDPQYPAERVNYMLEDSQSRFLLTHKNLISKEQHSDVILSKPYLKIIDLSNEAIFRSRDASNLGRNYSSNSLAYVIYTSGSTGTPKGVMIEHKSLVNYVNWRIKKYNYNSKDKILQLISVSFDGFGSNFYSSLLSGAELIFPAASHWGDFKSIAGMIRSKRITSMSVVPVMYRTILENSVENDLGTLRLVVLAGDRSSSELVEKSYEVAKHITLVNEYGPTENCIATTSFIGMSSENIDVIGRPIANNRIFIMNNDNNLMPIGVSGELCISGDSLARGYLNKDKLTSEKFVQNPFYPNEKMYRTGDYAKWLQDGNIQFVGRVDHQVKIRGYRVELSEIEKAILKTNLVEDAIIIDKVDISGNKYLCAYIIPLENSNISEIRVAIEKELPNYMVPTQFIKVDKFPLTPNGKINRKALSELDQFDNIEVEYVQPQNSIENEIVEIWSNLLKVERIKIGVNNNFFQMGGNSLLLMQVHNSIEKLYPDVVTIPDLFAYHTVSKLAEFIKAKSSKMTNEWQISCIRLPNEYFNQDTIGRQRSSLNFEVSSMLYDKIKEVCQSENVSTQDILLSAYVYLMAKVTGMKEFSLQAMVQDKDMICNISLDMSDIKDFSDLFTTIRQKVDSGVGFVYSVSKLSSIKVNKDELSVLPLFYNKSLLSVSADLLDLFDIIIEMGIYGNKAFFVCEYNSSLLKDDKVESIAQMYLKLIELMVSRYTKK